MRKQSSIAASLLVLSCAPGDLFGPPERPPINPHAVVGEAPSAAVMREIPSSFDRRVETQSTASMEGTLGAVRGFQARGLEVQTLRVPQGTLVEVHADNPAANWWVMAQLRFTVPLTDPAWAPGSSYRFFGGGNPLGLNILGCSGPARDRFTFDADALTVELVVSRGSTPAARVVYFTARWRSRDDVVRGVVELSPE